MNDEIQIPFVPSTWHKVEVMVELADAHPKQKVADLGSGDGRVLLAFADAGIEAHGYEINPELILQSEEKIITERLDHLAFIHPQDFYEADLSEYDIVTLFGMPSVMEKIKKKLLKDLKPGAKVISSIFKFPDWELHTVKDNVYLYVR